MANSNRNEKDAGSTSSSRVGSGGQQGSQQRGRQGGGQQGSSPGGQQRGQQGTDPDRSSQR